MTVSKTTRLGVTRWGSDDDPWDRDDFDDDNAALEALVAIARTGLRAARGAAAGAFARSLFYATDQRALWFSDGATWRRLELPNLHAYPMLTSIPYGSALTPLDGPQLGISDVALYHTMFLPGGATIDAISIARGSDGTDELYTKHAFITIYDAITGDKLATTDDLTGQQFFHGYQLSMSMAGGVWEVPASGRYMVVLVLQLETVGNVETQAKISGAPMPSTLANTAQINLTAGVDTPAEMPAEAGDLTGGGVVPTNGVPWFGFGLTT